MENLTFEEAIKELETTVNELESEKLSLEESLEKFNRGMQLSKHCNDLLEKAEQNITILIEQSNGTVIEEPFVVSKDE